MSVGVTTVLMNLPLAASIAEPGGRSLYPLILMVLVGCWATLGIALAAAWSHIRSEAFPPGKSARVGLALGGILLLGIAVRLWLSPLEPMLSTYSGLGHAADAYKVAAFDWSAPFQSAYPLTVQALAGMKMTVIGRSPEIFFYVVCSISLLMIPALYVIGRILWGRPHEGLVAALFASLFPPFILFSTSGSLALPYAALGSVSIALLLLWLRTGSKTLLVALLAALLLTLQTRLEAALFIVPVLATAALYDQRLPWKTLLGGRTISVVVAFLLLSLPYLANTLAEVNSELSSAEPSGFSGMANWMAWSALVLGIFYLWGRHHDRRQLGSLAWGSVCLGAAYFIAVQLLDSAWGLSNCFPGSEYLYTIPGADSFAPIGLMYIEPLLTPAGLTLAYCAAFATLNTRPARKRWLMLQAWFLPLMGITLVKATGELPFCGARTALAAAPPFLLLAAAGLTYTISTLDHMITDRRKRMVLAAAVAVGVVATFVAPLVATTSGPFNQQQEYRFVKGWIADLPPDSVVAYNNGPLALPADEDSCGSGSATKDSGVATRIGSLYRTDGLLTALLGTNDDGIVPIALNTAKSLLEATGNHPVYYYEGLDCWRTGKPAMMPICTEIRRRYKLEVVASVEFDNRLYGSDFLESLRIDLETVRLTLYLVRR